MRPKLLSVLAVLSLVLAIGLGLAYRVHAKQDQAPPGMDQGDRPRIQGQGPGQTVRPGTTRVFPGMPGMQMAQPGLGPTSMAVDGAHNALYICMGDVVYRLNATTLKQEATVRLQPPMRETPRPGDMPPPSEGLPGR